MSKTIQVGHVTLSNGNCSLTPSQKFWKKTIDDWYTSLVEYGSYGSNMPFLFTNPTGTKYFEVLESFYDAKKPMRITDVKESLGIPRQHWGSFTRAAQAFGMLERIPHSWNYKITTIGKTYVEEVRSGRSKFVLTFKEDTKNSKVVNLLVQVKVDGNSRDELVSNIDTICNAINSLNISDTEIVGETMVDGYWNSVDEYNSGAECHDDDCFEE